MQGAQSQTIPAKLYLSAGNRIRRGTSVRSQQTPARRGRRNTLQAHVAGSDGRWIRLKAGVKRERRPSAGAAFFETDLGIRNIKDSPDRYGAFRAIAEKLGETVKGGYYTMGHHDLVILEGTDEAVSTALLKAGSLGNVRSETLRGFSVDEAKRMIGNIQ